jgi:hypothetical protein
VTAPTIAASWAQARAARPARARRASLILALVAVLGRRLPEARRVRSTVMQLTAFGWLCWSAWQYSPTAGGIAIGISLFVIEALSDGGKK